MGAYLCIARNEVPPAVSKRVNLKVNCKYLKTISSVLYIFRYHQMIDNSVFIQFNDNDFMIKTKNT